MRTLHRLLLALAPLLALVAPAGAEGLVQLSLQGALSESGGGPVEIDWSFHDGRQVREVPMRLHLAQSTTASDVAALLAHRLRKAGAEVLFPGEHQRSSGVVSLFVEDTTKVNLRLNPGLSGTLTTCDALPERVRFLKPLAAPEPVRILVTASTFHPHSRMPGRVQIPIAAPAERTPASICEELFNQGLELGLVGERPSADSWRPTKAVDGASVTGCSVELVGASSDWGVQLELAVPL